MHIPGIKDRLSRLEKRNSHNTPQAKLANMDRLYKKMIATHNRFAEAEIDGRGTDDDKMSIMELCSKYTDLNDIHDFVRVLRYVADLKKNTGNNVSECRHQLRLWFYTRNTQPTEL